MKSLLGISNTELINRLEKLVVQEQNLTLTILPYLVEVERRRIYFEKAYSTLTDYCIHELGYGDSSVSRRMRAAWVIGDIPEVCDRHRDGSLTLSAGVRVSGLLSPDNKNSLLPRLVRKSRSEIEMVMAEYVSARKTKDQAKPALVKKLVAIESAPAGASSCSAAGAPPPELGEIPRHCEGANDPTVTV